MSNNTPSLQEKQLRTSESTSYWKTFLPESLRRNNLSFQSCPIKAKHSPNRQRQKWNKCNNNDNGRKILQDPLHWKSYIWDRFVFLQSFKRILSSKVTHHIQFSRTTVKYCFLFPKKGQWVLGTVGFLWFQKTASLNPRNNFCGTMSISSQLKPIFFWENEQQDGRM